MTNSIRMARLLNLMRVFRQEKIKLAPTMEEEVLLSYIVERHAEEKATTVSNLVATQLFGTPPTVQKKVNQLVAKDFLIFEKCSKDLRKLNLLPTPSAIEYFEDLFRHLTIDPIG